MPFTTWTWRPIFSASAVWLIPFGLSHSSSSTSPGSVGGGSRCGWGRTSERFMAGLLDLVIVGDSNAGGLALVEREQDAPLVVDSDAVRAGQVALQFLEVVAGAREVGELGGC